MLKMSGRHCESVVRGIGCVALLAALTGCAFSPQSREARAMKRGTEFLQKKDYSRAQLEFRTAVQVMPKDAEPYYMLAAAYMGSGSRVAAIAALRKAIELNPHHAGAQLKMAELMAATH